MSPRASSAWTASSGRTVRVKAKRSGVLRDLSIYVVATDAASVEVSVYDSGEASPGNLTRLFASGGVSIAGNNTWQTFSGIACNVIQGRDYYLMIGSNSSVLTVARFVLPNNASQMTLPTSFFPNSGGLLPKYGALVAAGYTAPATISEANHAANTALCLVIGRITDN